MADALDISSEWVGRLVRVLVVFRAFVLLVTLILLPSHGRTLIVAVAVMLAAMLSYVSLRRWEQIGPSVSRHPAYLGLEVLLATLILAAAGARSPFFYFTLGTAALAGVVYGRRGALPFSAVLISVYELVALEGYPTMHPLHDAQSIVFVPLLYPAAVAAGVAARELIQRGLQTDALLRERTIELVAERERLHVARELHDSLAKTVEGLALTASVLPARCERDPSAAATLARQLGDDARQAALEARALMSDLRPGPEAGLPLFEAIRKRAASFQERSGVAVRVDCASPDHDPELRPQACHELIRIMGEALINATRHGRAANVSIALRQEARSLRLSVADDGCGLSEAVDFEALKSAGHFGLVGMRERARAVGGELVVSGDSNAGTTVSVLMPIGGDGEASGTDPSAQESAPGAVSHRRWFGRRVVSGLPGEPL